MFFDYGNATFDWDNMLPQYSGDCTAEQADAVAQLMLACGVAVDMEYSPSASGAYSYQVGQALIDYLDMMVIWAWYIANILLLPNG